MTNHLFFKNAVTKPNSSVNNGSSKLDVSCGSGFEGALKALCIAVLDNIISNPLPVHDFLEHIRSLNPQSGLPTPYNFVQAYKENPQKQLELANKFLQCLVVSISQIWQEDSKNQALWLMTKPLNNYSHLAIINSAAHALGIEIVLSQTKHMREIPHMITCVPKSRSWTNQIGKFLIREHEGRYSVETRHALTNNLHSLTLPADALSIFTVKNFDESQHQVQTIVAENLKQLEYMQEKNLLNEAGLFQLIFEQISNNAFHGPDPKSSDSKCSEKFNITHSFMSALSWMMSCVEQKEINNNCALKL